MTLIVSEFHARLDGADRAARPYSGVHRELSRPELGDRVFRFGYQYELVEKAVQNRRVNVSVLGRLVRQLGEQSAEATTVVLPDYVANAGEVGFAVCQPFSEFVCAQQKLQHAVVMLVEPFQITASVVAFGRLVYTQSARHELVKQMMKEEHFDSVEQAVLAAETRPETEAAARAVVLEQINSLSRFSLTTVFANMQVKYWWK